MDNHDDLDELESLACIREICIRDFKKMYGRDPTDSEDDQDFLEIIYETYKDHYRYKYE